MSSPTQKQKKPICSTTASSNPLAFVPLTLYCAANAINLLVPTAPIVTAPTDMPIALTTSSSTWLYTYF
jgi:hypothetical protein